MNAVQEIEFEQRLKALKEEAELKKQVCGGRRPRREWQQAMERGGMARTAGPAAGPASPTSEQPLPRRPKGQLEHGALCRFAAGAEGGGPPGPGGWRAGHPAAAGGGGGH